jgi:hypothetical protein
MAGKKKPQPGATEAVRDVIVFISAERHGIGTPQ